MIDIGAVEMAKYPFLPDAGRYLQDSGFTVEKFGTDPDLRGVVDRAHDRIRVAAEGKIYRSGDLGAGQALDMEVFSFLVSVILLKLSRSGALVSKFVMAESRRAEQYLEDDLKDPLRKDEASAAKIIQDLFSVGIRKRDRDFAIPVESYVRRSVRFHEAPWKLVNRRVDGGMVLLTAHEAVRLIRQQLNVYIAERIRAARQPPMLPNFEEPVRGLEVLSRRFRTTGAAAPKGHPPCIKHAIKYLSEGKNLPHSGRFMLASYMISIGKQADEIVPLFKNAPDYNEKVTRYQLGHIAGGGDGAGYKCPSCYKIKSNDLCFETQECSGIVNPLQFGRRRPPDA